MKNKYEHIHAGIIFFSIKNKIKPMKMTVAIRKCS